MVAKINKWIETGSDYQEGVMLFDQFGSDNFLKRLFKRKESTFNKQKLTELLTAILSDEQEVIDQSTEIVNIPCVKEETLTPSGEVPELLKVISQINANYTEIRGLHPYLSLLPEGDQLRDLAENIKRLGKRNSELWQRRNYINEHGSDIIEISPAAPVMIDLNLINEREQVRKSLNRAENRLKKQDPKKPNTIALIAERKKELQVLDEKIAQFKMKGGAIG